MISKGSANLLKTKALTRTALLTAMLVAVQYVTRSMGQFVTGSCVNLILFVAAELCGGWGAAAVALLSPFCAFLLGIGTPILRLVPAIALGNLVIVLVSRLLREKNPYLTVAAAAVCKFLLLYVLIVKLLLPSLGLPEAKAAALSASFSYPQLFTALIGGTLSVPVRQVLKRTLAKE